MALSDDRIFEIAEAYGTLDSEYRRAEFARAIEAEVHKQDDALIQTVLEVFKTLAYKLPENRSTIETCYAINDLDRDRVHLMVNLLRKLLENT